MSLFLPDQPYNQLPILPPQVDVESKVVLKQCILSRAALAELKQVANQLPNQAVLINTLPLLEAQASSEIENIVTTTDRLFQFSHIEDTSHADPATKEALRYRTALRNGYDSLKHRPLNQATAIRICSTIKGIDMDVRAVPGTALANDKTHAVIYTPPEGQAVLRKLLQNLDVFLHDDDDLDPLIKMAIGHYQFEAIHPFTDGNGRTGRILNILYLIDRGLLDIPVLYLSRYIIQNKTAYYERLRDVTINQSWDDWILFMLRAVEETAIWTSNKIRAILKLMQETRGYMKVAAAQIYSRELADLLFAQPYCRIASVVEAKVAKRQTASVYLKRLVELNVLNEIQVGREKLFINPRFMHLLLKDDNNYQPFH